MKNIVREHLDIIQRSAAVIESFGYDVADIHETVRDINEAIVCEDNL